MTQAAEDILKRAMELPPEDRLTVAQGLWDSVDPLRQPTLLIDQGLMAEIDRRDAEMDNGQVTPLTHDELMASVRKALECRRATTLSSTET